MTPLQDAVRQQMPRARADLEALVRIPTVSSDRAHDADEVAVGSASGPSTP